MQWRFEDITAHAPNFQTTRKFIFFVNSIEQSMLYALLHPVNRKSLFVVVWELRWGAM